MNNSTLYKSPEQIARISKDSAFVALATEYLEVCEFRNELREEILNVTAFPRVIQTAVDRLLKYHTAVIRAEAELESRGLTKEDVFLWQYDTLSGQLT